MESILLKELKSCRSALLWGGALVLLSRASGLILPISTKFLVDNVLAERHFDWLLPFAALLLIIACLHGWAAFFAEKRLAQAGQEYVARIRIRVQSHLLKLPVIYHDINKSGALVSRVMHDVEGVQNLFAAAIFDILGSLFAAGIAFGILFWLSPTLALWCMALAGAYGFWYFLHFERVKATFSVRNGLQADVSGRLLETLAGVRTVKTYSAESREEWAFSEGAKQVCSAAISISNLTSRIDGVSIGWAGVTAALTVAVGGHEIIAGTLSVGGLVTILVVEGFLIAPIHQVASAIMGIGESLAAVERTQELLSHEKETTDAKRTVISKRLRGEVVFEDVYFAYAPQCEVLSKMSFQAQACSVTALVGPSGAGKSTVMSLIAAFYVPQKGRILIDGIDLSTLELGSYRRNLGIVLQDTFLFSGTVRENIALARPDAGFFEIQEAARLAGVDEFVQRLPEGYDTVVGERGATLSGGQKQRVSIARAILANPRILILDEALSNLDAESEFLVQAGLDRLFCSCTTFLIAHKLSTVRKAANIFVLESGAIVESGSFEDLAIPGSRFSGLHALN